MASAEVVAAGGRSGEDSKDDSREPENHVIRACGTAFFHVLGDPERETTTKFHRTAQDVARHGVEEIVSGGTFVVALTRSGVVYQWGTVYHQVYPSPTPVLTSPSHRIAQVACGDKHAVAVTTKGVTLSWGCGLFGRLGLGTHSSHTKPQVVQVGDPARAVVRVGCGCAHSGAITVDGDVFMWGINKFSQCGGRPCEYIMSPQKLRMPATDGQRPVDITGGKHHSIMLTEDGQVYAWGAGAGGRLGFRCPLGEMRTPKRINTFRRSVVTQIASGDFHNIALTADGVTFTFGIGADGQNGNEKCVNHLNPKPVVTLLPENVGEGVAFVGAGATHSFAVTESGRLYTWGNHDGGLGHGRDVPTLPHALDKFTQRRIQDAKILTPKVVVLPAAVRYTMNHRERVVMAAGGKAHTVIVSALKRRTTGTRGATWAPPVAPPGVSSKSPSTKDSAYVSSDSEPEEDELEKLQESVRDAFTLARAIAQGTLFVKAGGGFTRASDGKAFANAAEALRALGVTTVASASGETEGGDVAVGASEQHMDRVDSGAGSGVGDGADGVTMDALHPVATKRRVVTTSVGGKAREEEGDAGDPLDDAKYAYMKSMDTIMQRTTSTLTQADQEAATADASDAALLLQACRHGHTDVVNELINGGFPIEVRDKWGNTPLIVACQSNQVPAAVSLLRAGANANAQNNKGQTALHYCHRYSFTGLVALLEQFGAEDTIQNAAGLTCYEGLTADDLHAFD